METGTVWGVTLYLVGFVATIAATQILLGALLPRQTAATRRALRARPVASTLVGIAGLTALILSLFVIGQVLQKIGLEIVVAVLIAGASLVILFGLGAVAAEIGQRLPSGANAAPGWRATIRGSVALSLASLLPVAGWFIVFPLSWAAGLGATFLALFGVGAEVDAASARPAVGDTIPAPVAAPRTAADERAEIAV